MWLACIFRSTECSTYTLRLLVALCGPFFLKLLLWGLEHLQGSEVPSTVWQNQQNPGVRSVTLHLTHWLKTEEEKNENHMLSTIQVPRDMLLLTDACSTINILARHWTKHALAWAGEGREGWLLMSFFKMACGWIPSSL